MTQSGRHDAISNSCVNPKIKRLPVKTPVTSCWYTALSYRIRNCDADRFCDLVVQRALCVWKSAESTGIPSCL